MKSCQKLRSILSPALLTSVLSASALAQAPVGLPGAPFPNEISLAGDAINNELVPRSGVSISVTPSYLPPVNLGTFNIVINPGAGLAGNAPALAAFNRAAQSWETYISDPITVTIDANLGALGAGIIGSASAVVLQAPYFVIRDQMVADGADEPDDLITQSLPTTAQFGAFTPNGRSLNGLLIGTKANLKALEFADLDADFGVSDGSITFSNTFGFDFDNSDGVGAGLVDFETVAAHEIGHTLGFISIVDSVNNSGTTAIPFLTLDMYRFGDNFLAPDGSLHDPSNPAEFSTMARNFRPGVTAITDTVLDATPEYLMSTGLFNALFPGTDGRQASHWKADELSGNFIGLMDPTLANQQVYPLSAPDLRALDLIGYDIGAVPEPSGMFAALGLIGLLGWRVLRRA